MYVVTDAGMTSNLAADMLALVELGEAWCGANGSAPDAAACGSATRQKISWLQSTAATLGERTQDSLWNEQAGAFVNKMPAEAYADLSEDTFYPRISPTSFYPLMPGHATATQAERMVHDHLLSPTGFCVTPEADWPPPIPAPQPNSVMLQSWHVSGAGNQQQVVLCRADGGGAAAAAAPGGCAAVKAVGGSFFRNESIAWATAGDGRTPLFLYHLPVPNQTVIGSATSFPAADKVSGTPVCYVAEEPSQPGSWPLRLWSSNRAPSSSFSSSASAAVEGSATALTYRLSGGPQSDNQIESSQDSRGPLWNLSATLGWAQPLPHACYWGLPSVSFADPAFAR